MNCPNGHSNQGGDKFCTTCGLQISSIPSTPPNPIQQPAYRPDPYQTQNPYTPSSPGNQGWGMPTQQPGYTTAQPSGGNGATKAIISVISIIGVIAVVAVVAIAASGGSTPFVQPKEDIEVSMTIFPSGFSSSGCPPSFGYSDVAGSTVTITDETGAVLGTGRLPSFGEGSYTCKYSTTIYGVKADSQTYYLEIGRRGRISSTKAELVSNSWAFGATLGL